MTRTPAVMEIEPCPFCRAHASVFQDDGDYYVSCTECWSQSPLKEEKTEAIAAWNRRTPAEPLADGEMIEKLVREAYEEGVEDGMERGFDPTDGAPQWIDSVARIETLRAIAAYNPNENQPTADAYMASNRALNWRNAQLRAYGIEPLDLGYLGADAPDYPPDDYDFGAKAAGRNPNDRLREALRQADKAMTCDEDEDSAHYCPNCDCSIFDAREAVRAALSHKD